MSRPLVVWVGLVALALAPVSSIGQDCEGSTAEPDAVCVNFVSQGGGLPPASDCVLGCPTGTCGPACGDALEITSEAYCDPEPEEECIITKIQLYVYACRVCACVTGSCQANGQLTRTGVPCVELCGLY